MGAARHLAGDSAAWVCVGQTCVGVHTEHPHSTVGQWHQGRGYVGGVDHLNILPPTTHHGGYAQIPHIGEVHCAHVQREHAISRTIFCRRIGASAAQADIVRVDHDLHRHSHLVMLHSAVADAQQRAVQAGAGDAQRQVHLLGVRVCGGALLHRQLRRHNEIVLRWCGEDWGWGAKVGGGTSIGKAASPWVMRKDVFLTVSSEATTPKSIWLGLTTRDARPTVTENLTECSYFLENSLSSVTCRLPTNSRVLGRRRGCDCNKRQSE